jgi:hypothetical protein
MCAVATSQDVQSLERIRIAHICQHWRDVALTSAELWSNILFTAPKIAELMVTRAKKAPLTIALAQGDIRLLAPLSEILCHHSDHARSVEVTNISNADFLPLLATSMPMLEKLVLRFRYLLPSTLEDEVTGPDLPSRILHKSPPVLKHFEISASHMPLYDMLPLVPTLIYLQLGTSHPLGHPQKLYSGRCVNYPGSKHSSTELRSLWLLPLRRYPYIDRMPIHSRSYTHRCHSANPQSAGCHLRPKCLHYCDVHGSS